MIRLLFCYDRLLVAAFVEDFGVHPGELDANYLQDMKMIVGVSGHRNDS